ncbi:MAG: hypothetical protein MR965_00985 [Lachnospiraceae bacterium]|nr:hypothetical protein [Lachnospiraceae bacterium]
MPVKYKRFIFFFLFIILLIGSGTFILLSPDLSVSFHRQTAKAPSQTASFGAIHSYNGRSAQDTHQELTLLIKRYYTAKQQVDMDTIAECVSNVGHIDEKKLMTEAEYVEGYENINCRILDGATKGSYRIYVYYDVKIYDIDTPIPSLNALYIKQDDSGNCKIYLDTLKSEEQQYIDKLDNSRQVQELVKSVQNQLHTVISQDSQVRGFYEMLENAQK